MVEAINGLTSALTAVNRVRQTATTTNTNVTNEETLLENQNGSNVHLRTQPEYENSSNVHMRTQPRTDDEVSLITSNLWFGNNANDPPDHHRVNDNGKNANPEDNQPALLNEQQEYWQQNINEYEEDTSYGPEISSCIAGASKIFRMKPMKDDNLKLKLEKAKISSICTF